MTHPLDAFRQRGKKAYEKIQELPEDQQAFAMEVFRASYDLGYEEAYWDWREKILEWLDRYVEKGEDVSRLQDYVKELRSKKPPEISDRTLKLYLDRLD